MRQPRLTESVLPHLVILAALAVVPLFSWWLQDPFLIRLFTRIVIFATAAVALNLVLGFAGLVSLLHAGFMGMGGYIIGILAFHEANDVHLGFGTFVIPGTSELLFGLPSAAVRMRAARRPYRPGLPAKFRRLLHHDHARVQSDDLLFLCCLADLRRR